MRLPIDRCAVLLLAALVACSPTLDWREVRVDDAALSALFPCKPQRRVRNVQVGRADVLLEMTACTADGSTYAVSFLSLRDPADVTRMLEALRAAAIGNIGGDASRSTPFMPAGATPNLAAARLGLAGRLPGGAAVQHHAAFFTRGLRVYQAGVVGAAPSSGAVEVFMASLKFPR